MKKTALDKSVEYMKDWLRFLHERGDTPGFVVAVSHKGEVLFNEAYGYADLENKEKMTPQHIFRIASHSKTFTATAIMQLQEQGKLKIDDRVADYVPWLKDHKDKRFRNITIRQVMSHGAGIIRDGLDCTYWALERPFPDTEQLKREILEAELVLNNNIKLKYSNFGYALLGVVVKVASSQDYNDYVVKNIIEHLGIENTGPDYAPAIKDKIVTGYTAPDYEGKKRLPIANASINAMSSATGFYSTTKDLCTYFSAHIIGSGQLLNDESKKEMQRLEWNAENQPDKQGYGLGFVIDFINERQTIGHSGGLPGHITKTICDPNEELVVTVLTNAIDGSASYMAKSILKLIDFFQDKWQPPSKDLEKYEGRFMNLWVCTDVVASEDKLFLTSSVSWESFDYPDELQHIDAQTFMIVKTDSFGSNGELVKFTLDQGEQAENINYAGAKLLKEKDYIAQTTSLKKIGEQFEPK